MSTDIDISTLSINRLIVHDIPKHKKNDDATKPKLSKNVSELPNSLKAFFKVKILQAFKSDKSLKVSYQLEGSTSPVKTVMSDLLNKRNPDFVGLSHVLGQHLFTIQVGSNAAGILLIIEGEVSGHPTSVIMKLERDNGAQLTLNSRTESFDIVEVRDLMLTQKTRIFKVALMIDSDQLNTDYDGYVTDYQISIKRKMKATSFFIDDFLGCEATAEPKVYTQRFYSYSKAFINQTSDPITKTKYTNDLNSYIQKNQSTLSAREFAEDYLETPAEKDRYKNYLQSVRFPFDAAILKDTQLIQSKIKRIAVDFVNGVSIVGTKGVLDENVTIEPHGEDGHKAEIISKIRHVN